MNAILPRKIPKAPKRASRWRSQAHCNFVRSHACSNCGSTTAIEVAHVRNGSGAGIGQKPDDWRAVSLCKLCHKVQHSAGEQSFWASYAAHAGHGVEDLIKAFIKSSPKRAEIELVKMERAHGR